MHHHDIVDFFHDFITFFLISDHGLHSPFQILYFLTHQLDSIQIRKINSFILLRRLIKQVISQSILITEVHFHVFGILQVLTEYLIEVEHEFLQLFAVHDHQSDAVV